MWILLLTYSCFDAVRFEENCIAIDSEPVARVLGYEHRVALFGEGDFLANAYADGDERFGVVVAAWRFSGAHILGIVIVDVVENVEGDHAFAGLDGESHRLRLL